MSKLGKGLPPWRRASIGVLLSGGHVPSISTLVFGPRIEEWAGLEAGRVSLLLFMGGIVGGFVLVGWLWRWGKWVALVSMVLLCVAVATLAARPEPDIASATAAVVGFLSMGVEGARKDALATMHPDRLKRLRQALPLQVPNVVTVALTWFALEQLSGERHSGWLPLHHGLAVVPFVVALGIPLLYPPPGRDKEREAAEHGSRLWVGVFAFATSALHGAFSALIPHLAAERGATDFSLGRLGSVFGLLAFLWLSLGRNGGRRCEPRTAIVWGSLLSLAGALGLGASSLSKSGTAFTVVVVAAGIVFLLGVDVQLLTLEPFVSASMKGAATARVCEPLGALFFPAVMLGIWPRCPEATHVPIVLGLVAIAGVVNVVAVRRWLAAAGWSGTSEVR